MKETLYCSTRNSELRFKASEAILKGISDDGGLFVPVEIPALDKTIDELKGKSYQDIAYEVMKLYMSDFTEEELKACINNAYDSKFDTKEIAPLKEADGAYYLELFHGKTIAFKDMALSILPHLMTTSAKKNNITNKIIILTATSGDTGKAALAGFADVDGTGIVVFYPKGGVSPIQEKQMVTQTGDNTCVVSVHGNFDDCQSGVKRIFADEEYRALLANKGYQFSSANSINIGRLVPQIVYYVYSYVKLVADGVITNGEKVNFVVPTGNFGNILAAYYAKNMGIPVNKLICASNENKVLFDFFNTGKYDKNREFILTSSPSMDILISSNLERLIYKIAGEDDKATKEMMSALVNDGVYSITDKMASALDDFAGYYSTEDKTFAKIKTLYEKTGYVIDTHTAVAAAAYDDYKAATNDDTKTVIASTASPFKFLKSVMKAIDSDKYGMKQDFDLIDDLSAVSKVKIPQAVEDVRNAPVKHTGECDIADMKKAISSFLGI